MCRIITVMNWLLAFLMIVPFVSNRGQGAERDAVFDLNTLTVALPSVFMQPASYNVNLVMSPQDGLLYLDMNSFYPATDLNHCATFDIPTGTLTIPNLRAGTQAFSVTLQYCGGVIPSFAILDLHQIANGPTVETPIISPSGGTFIGAQTVTISCATVGAAIRYTTDGSEPISASTQYSAALTISSSQTIQAKAFASGLADSATATAVFVIDPTAATCMVPLTLPSGAMPLVLNRISAGTFTMGSPGTDSDADSDENPQHQVTLSTDFHIGAYEVTQAQWQAVAGSNPSSSVGINMPVEQVSWNDIQGFLAMINNSYAPNGYEFVLPTEAQWEYACRAGTTSKWCFGSSDSSIGDYAWYKDNSGSALHDVGGKQANAWGLYDMHGNVWEWCRDWSDSSYYSSSPSIDPQGPESGTKCVVRGGSWGSSAKVCRSANRSDYGPDSRLSNDGYGLGFRLVLEVKKVQTPTISPNGGTFTSIQTVSISCATSNAIIRYTIDGSEPISTSTQYITALTVSSSQTIKAKAFASGMAESTTATASFAIVSAPSTFTISLSLPSGATQLVMKKISAGSFMMGSPDSDTDARANEKPQHRVTLTKDFYLGVYEVTQAQWKAVMGSNPSASIGNNKPVEQLRKDDVQAFLTALNDGGYAPSGYTFVLPTEAQWEYACRTGTTTKWSFGDSDSFINDYAWHSGNSGNIPHDVGGKQANAWGLYDMHGNVWEWCRDWYGSYGSSQVTDPQGASSGTYHVLRGGGVGVNGAGCRSAYRDIDHPDWPVYDDGVRLCLELK